MEVERSSSPMWVRVSEEVTMTVADMEVKVNIPLLAAIKQIPSYAKFLKDLCTIKRKHQVKKKAFLTEHLGLGELKPTEVKLQLADQSVRTPRGITEDVLV
ncbi:hypothetical protein L3X38_035255 [Prunus dulcis]|uniref:Uncharacterized protein n=1 Tax=Prunus dulcis TaxID=3755 RepID=A0AAD4YYI1_PRUDU|nr:hypothetical protein L3X38_035255 [Prunus dulcis]